MKRGLLHLMCLFAVLICSVSLSGCPTPVDPNTGKGRFPTDWTAVSDTTFGSSSSIYGIAYGGGKFVAVGEDEDWNGKAAYSSDGITWTAVNDATVSSCWMITGIAYGDGKFIMVSVNDDFNGQAAYSQDGITWTAISDTAFDAFWPFGIAYGGGKWIIAGDNADNGVFLGRGKAAYSSDGITWTVVSDTAFTATFGSSWIGSVAYGDGKFIAVGQNGKAAYSSDGAVWWAIPNTTFDSSAISDIVYGGEKWVAVGSNGKAAYCTPGTTPGTKNPPLPPQKILRVTGLSSYQGKFLVAGIGTMTTASVSVIATCNGPIPITSDTVDVPLYDNDDASYNTPWTTSGTYAVTVGITAEDGSVIYWQGGAVSIALTETITAVPFSTLIEIVTPGSISITNDSEAQGESIDRLKILKTENDVEAAYLGRFSDNEEFNDDGEDTVIVHVIPYISWGRTQTFSNIAPGKYYVKISLYSSFWGWYHYRSASFELHSGETVSLKYEWTGTEHIVH